MKTGLTLLGITGTLLISRLAHAETSILASAEIYAITAPMGGVAVQPDGKIVVSCGCHLYALDTNSGIINLVSSGAFRFHSDGSLDRTFQCNIEPANISAPQSAHLTTASGGRLFLTGVFHAVDGKPRNGYAMILPDGKLDESFEPWRGYSNAPARCGRAGALYPAALLTNGHVAVPSFTIACSPFNYLTAYVLDPSGAFLPRPGIDIISNDWPYAQMSLLFRDGGFGAQRSIDWHRNTRTTWTSWPQEFRNVAFPLWGDPPSAADAAVELTALFKEAPIELCRYAVRLPDGGAILAVEGTNGSHLMRFDSAWRPDFTFTNSFEMRVNHLITLIHQPDDKLLLAGEISKLNGETFPGLVRLLPDGSADPSFHCVIGGDPLAARVMGMALQDDGHILIVGFFSEVNGVKCPHIARLNPDGSLDNDFQKHFTSYDNLQKRRRVPVQMLAAAQNSMTNLSNNVTAANTSATSPQTVLITSLTVDGGIAMIKFQGNPSQTYFLQASDNLAASAWNIVVTNKTDSAGIGVFRDVDAEKFSMRFYRVASPP